MSLLDVIISSNLTVTTAALAEIKKKHTQNNVMVNV